MTTWLVSDTHLFHEKLLGFQRKEFTCVEEMNNHIIEMWKTLVKPDDRVFHLGDFAFGDNMQAIEDIVKSLPGRVTLVIGNHDTPVKCQLYSKYWKLASHVCDGKYCLSHVPVHPALLNETTPRSMGEPTRFCIHGHCHKPLDLGDKYFNVNWDVLGEAKFLNFTDVKAKLSKQG